MSRKLNVRIAGIGTSIAFATPACEDLTRKFLREFLVEDCGEDCFKVEFSPKKDLIEFCFRHNEDDISKNVLGMTVGMGHIDKEANYAVIADVADESIPVAEFILDNFLRICLQYAAPAQGGVFLHSSAVVDQGKSFVFVAPNEGGKSTIAANTGLSVLSDDCVGIMKNGAGAWYACATPWGDVHTRGEHPIAALFFIEKADEFFCRPVSSIAAIKSFFANISLSFSDFEECSERIMDDILGIVTDVSKVVPMFHLGFRKEDNVIDIIKNDKVLWNSVACTRQ